MNLCLLARTLQWSSPVGGCGDVRKARHETTSTYIQPTNYRSFSTYSIYLKQSPLPPRPTLPDETLTHTYVKGSGPGGQKINKTNSAVQITHGPTGIVVKSQATRSRSQNYKIARRILAEKVELVEKGGESRVELKRIRDSKKRRSAEKKKRRKYRALEEGREAGEAAAAAEEEREGVDDFDVDTEQGEALNDQVSLKEVEGPLEELVEQKTISKTDKS